MLVVTLCGSYEEIERIEAALRELSDFTVAEGYRTEFEVSIATGVVEKKSSCRLVFENGVKTVRVFVREPGEMRVRIEGSSSGPILWLLDRLPLPKQGLKDIRSRHLFQ